MLLNAYHKSYKGKEEFLQFLQEKLLYDKDSRNMVSRDDVVAACESFFKQRDLKTPSTVSIGQHLRGSGVKVSRYGPMNQQKYCYVGFSWKGDEFETIQPAKRGRKVKNEGTGRKRQRIEDTEEKVEDWNLAGGYLAPCAVVWKGDKAELVRKSVAELKEKVRESVTNKVEGWWNKKYDLEEKIKELLKKKREREELESAVEETDAGKKLEMLFEKDTSAESEVEEKDSGQKLDILADDLYLSDEDDATAEAEEREAGKELEMPFIEKDTSTESEVEEKVSGQKLDILAEDLYLSDEDDATAEAEERDAGKELNMPLIEMEHREAVKKLDTLSEDLYLSDEDDAAAEAEERDAGKELNTVAEDLYLSDEEDATAEAEERDAGKELNTVAEDLYLSDEEDATTEAEERDAGKELHMPLIEMEH